MSKHIEKPYEGKAPYIFVSYSHMDKATVFPVIDRLIKDGYRVWYDEGITPGANWPQVLAKRLGACKVCLTFISSNWLASQYCNMEIGYATNHQKAIIPVRLEDVKPKDEVDFLLTINHYIDKFVYESEETFLEKLYEAPCMEECKEKDGLNETPEVSVAPKEKAGDRRNLSLIMVVATVGILIALIALICVLIWFGNQLSNAGDDGINKVTPSVAATTAPEKDEMFDHSGTTTAPELSVAPETTTKVPETTTQAPETTTKAPETTQAPETTTQAPETTVTPPKTAEPTESETYTPPTSLGTDLLSGIISIEGDLYRLPMPVGAFVENGWRIADSPNEFLPGGGGYVTLRRSGATLTLWTENFTDSETSAENCHITSIGLYGNANIDIVLPNGISFDSDKAEVVRYMTDDFSESIRLNNYCYDSKLNAGEVLLSIIVDSQTDKVWFISVRYN